jgi:hypothetical protein
MMSQFIAVAALGLLAADGGGMYLPPSETGGSEFQFDPDSRELRQATSKLRQPKPGDLLDARALADDLVFLRRALRKLYPGYPELLQLPDFDVEALFDQHIARLRAGPGRVTFGDSAAALMRELKSRINDRHLNMYGVEVNDGYTEYQTQVTAPAPSLKGCTAPQMSPTTLRIAPVLGVDGRQAQLLTVSAKPQGETLELTCDQGRRFTLKARPSVAREESFFAKPVYEWRRAGDVAIVRIRRFSGPPAALEQLEQLAADYPQHRRYPLIVVDMRGNAGGNDSYAYRWVAQAKRGRWATNWWTLHPTPAFDPWVEWNREVWSALEQNRIDDPTSVARRQELRQRWPRSPAELSLRFEDDQNESQARTPYRGRIVVLVDGKCGSSGESGAQFFRDALGAKLVGERTAGFMEYGNVRALLLPRTHVLVVFATKRNYFSTPLEAVGMPADLYLPPELMEKPVEELLPLLKKVPVGGRRDRGVPGS